MDTLGKNLAAMFLKHETTVWIRRPENTRLTIAINNVIRRDYEIFRKNTLFPSNIIVQL